MEARQQRSLSVVWMAALVLTSALIVVWGFLNPTLEINDPGYAVGSALGIAVLAAPIFTLIFGRFWRGRGWIAFAAILGSVLISILITSERNRSASKQMISFLRDDMLGAVSNSDPLVPMQDITPGVRPGGDIGAVQNFVVEMYNMQAGTQREYLAALDEMKWDSVLDPVRIERDVSFDETRRLIAAGRATIRRFHDADIAYIDGLEARARKVPVSSPTVLDELLKGLRRGIADNRPTVAEMWRLESEVVGHIELVAEFLHSTRGSWAYEGGQLLFATDEDVAEYNQRFAAIDDTMIKQEKLRAEQVAAAEVKLRAAEDRLDPK